MATVNSTHIALIGGGIEGSSLTNKFHLYSIDTMEWTEMPPMEYPRVFHFCGAKANSKIFVGGGPISGTATEVFDLATNSWEAGPELPYPLEGAATVVTNDTFLIMGGESEGRLLDTMFELELSTETWNPRPEVMKNARKYFGATFIDDDYYFCGQ